jgi:hypothetical protein
MDANHRDVLVQKVGKFGTKAAILDADHGRPEPDRNGLEIDARRTNDRDPLLDLAKHPPFSGAGGGDDLVEVGRYFLEYRDNAPQASRFGFSRCEGDAAFDPLN